MTDKTTELLRAEMVMKRLASQTLAITVDGVEKRLNIGSLTARDDQVATRQLGRPLLHYIEPILAGSVALDGLAALWWMARRHDGEPDLTYDAVLDEFPTFGEVLERVRIDAFGPDDEEADLHPEG